MDGIVINTWPGKSPVIGKIKVFHPYDETEVEEYEVIGKVKIVTTSNNPYVWVCNSFYKDNVPQLIPDKFVKEFIKY